VIDVSSNPLRVLVIDDHRSMRSIIKSLLHKVGLDDVAEAENGKVALAYLRSPDVEFPDVIICDLHMDEMDGIQFCNVVRNDKNLRNHHVPIVILTGDSDKMLHEVSKQVGAMSVLTKPVSAEFLGKHIEKAVGYAFA
jgi:two-component system chemotaxis response regulator CheY